MKKYQWILIFVIGSIFCSIQNGQASSYPDQHYVIVGGDSLFANRESSQGIMITSDGRSIKLQDSFTSGYIIFKPQQSDSPFNRGLPSWNGTAPDQNSSFKVQMRFPQGSGWSPWLIIGYWKEHIWRSYGTTNYTGGYIDYDYVKLYSYKSRFQFKIMMKRNSINYPSPTVHKLSFFVSDSRTTNNINYSAILNDNPDEIFIPTTFLHQYKIDNQIGHRICSPTSVSMILLSYGIEVDALQFARDTYHPIHHLFGVWPRVVQNASEYGLDGAVTRYRTWSEARKVLANGGRIAMSVGDPLYSGHLMMLAGFTKNGTPRVHDPARSNGYDYRFSKSDLSHSWFDKGGISYTFYLADTTKTTVIADKSTSKPTPKQYCLFQNYPNPFNVSTMIRFQIPEAGRVTLHVYSLLGEEVATLLNRNMNAGSHQVTFDGTGLASGVYFYTIKVDDFIQTKKCLLMK